MISVLMSVYKNDNVEHFNDAMVSIINQDVMPNQIVIVCDGPLFFEYYKSIDYFKEKFDFSGVKFTLVKLPKNVGLGLALKEGVAHCEEKYILRMDSDDISRVNRIDVMNKFILENPEVDAFGSHIEEFTNVLGDLGRFRRVPLVAEDIIRFGKKRNPMNHVTMCIKKDSLIGVGSYESVIYHEDYFLWVKMILAGFKLRNIDDCLVDVRVGNDLIGRRIGLNYFKLEVNFAKKCFIAGYFNAYDYVRYLAPRFFFRIMPSSLLNSIYSQLRA
ncbi:Glyco_trans_2-like domain-containing protein [Vibrio chagasii]|nr:Glyco_trans_2-like domain-containing protein [Vibrio chagasii]CAH6907684.1 Glyco_trans_2-like domain-containing protein [Vibrio chagasii]CAH7178238.1 Glyco_trans_2-like domain-containing protein [Vibrio chagasii]